MMNLKRRVSMVLVLMMFVSLFSVFGAMSVYAVSKPAQVKSLTLSSITTSSCKVAWKKVKGAKGYEVYRKEVSDGSYTRIKTTTGTSFRNTGLSSNTKYYYKVRAYSKSGAKKLYGNFSAIKSITTKKNAASSHSIQYIGDRSVEYNSAYDVHRVFFALFYEDEITRTSSSGTAEIVINNSNGVEVFNKDIRFSQNDFSNWTNPTYGTRYLCCIEIPTYEITESTVDRGTLSLAVKLDSGEYFSARRYSINKLPIKQAQVNFVCEPGQIVYYNKMSNYVQFTNVTYSINNERMTIKFKATRKGATYDYMFAGYKIKSGDSVVASGSVVGDTSLGDLEVGESAYYTINLDIEDGGYYELVFVNR